MLTLLTVAVYAGLTFWQGCLTRRLVTISQKTFDASERPYIGLFGIDVLHVWFDSQGNWHSATTEDTRAIGMDFDAGIKNFGPVPGPNFSAEWKVFLNGRPLEEHRVPDLPTTLFPTQMVRLSGSIRGEDYKAIIKGGTISGFDVTIQYDTPSGQVRECQKQQYSPEVNGFVSLGKCASF
ncbi:MAG: hypothetical protein WA628_18265 [Terriglobales bacterium]